MKTSMMKFLRGGWLCVWALMASIANAATITYYHNDLLGSPVAATNASGQVIWRESYRPYGERLTNSAASSGNKVWYASRRQDAETGLVYMGARYYDPVVGRFTATDPVGFLEANVHSHNRYAYANNNPYRYVDPDGKSGQSIVGRVLVPLVALALKGMEQSAEQRDKNVEAAQEAVRKLLGLTGILSEGSDKGASEGKSDGKGPKVGKEKDVPDRAEPGEFIQGERRGREYGADGRPLRDYDKPHRGYESPHVHEWDNGVREHPGRDYSPVPRETK